MKRFVTAVLVTAFVGLLGANPASAQSLTLTSPAFTHDDPIPMHFSAYGDNVSPELNWTGAPAGTRSYALVLHDPDAPLEGGFVHWVIYNIPGGATGLPEGLPSDAELTTPADLAGTTQGNNGLRRPGYFGPRPPAGSGVHNYNFRLFALDLAPELDAGLDSAGLMDAIDGHILGSTTLTGIYQVK